jgi:integrase
VEKFKLARAHEISPAGTNPDLAALRFVLNFAIRQEYLVKNPVSSVRFLPEGPGSVRVVSHEEQQKYLVAASPTLQHVARLILETGMRPEEIFTIRSENVHLAKRYLSVPNGKTRFAKRNIPLTDAAIEILKLRVTVAKGPYLFANRKNANLPMITVQKCHEAALRKAKISPAFRLYDLRHTFGSRSAMAGVDLATLKELMGHSNISITMRYVHPTPEHKCEALRKLDRYNTEQVFLTYETRLGSPQKSPQ